MDGQQTAPALIDFLLRDYSDSTYIVAGQGRTSMAYIPELCRPLLNKIYAEKQCTHTHTATRTCTRTNNARPIRKLCDHLANRRCARVFLLVPRPRCADFAYARVCKMFRLHNAQHEPRDACYLEFIFGHSMHIISPSHVSVVRPSVCPEQWARGTPGGIAYARHTAS